MKLIERVFILHLLLATALLAIAYALGGSLEIAYGMILVGAFWFYTNRRNAHGMESLLFMTFTVASAALFYWFKAPGWMPLFAVVAALGAWDLDYFLQRLKIVTHEGPSPRLGIEHLRRLALAEGLGLLLGIIGLTLHTQISFWVALALALLAAIALSRLIAFLRKEI